MELGPTGAGKGVCQEIDSSSGSRCFKGCRTGFFSRPDFENSSPASVAGARVLESPLMAPIPANVPCKDPARRGR